MKLVEHERLTVLRRGPGEFVVEQAGARPLSVRPAPGGWVVEGVHAKHPWFLSREEEEGGFALQTGPAEHEVSRTTALESAGHQRELRYLLMGDGRLFRIALRGPTDSRYELSGWETHGAYLTARPEGQRWRIDPNPASSGLPDIRSLAVLFAAEILDSGEPLQAG